MREQAGPVQRFRMRTDEGGVSSVREVVDQERGDVMVVGVGRGVPGMG